MIFVISTIAIILTVLMLIVIGKGHKKSLISFDSDSQTSKDLITFINHISRRDKFKRFKYFSFFSFIS